MTRLELIVDSETVVALRTMARAEDATPSEIVQDAILRDMMRRKMRPGNPDPHIDEPGQGL